MRSAALFLALLAAGVLIVLIFIWSGESIPVLIMSIVSLFAVLALVEWRPWEDRIGGAADRSPHREASPEPIAGRAPSTEGVSMGTVGAGSGRKAAKGRAVAQVDDEPRVRQPTWRAKFDVTSDERGVSGVPVGERAPQMWAWSQIDDIGSDWCEEMAGTSPTSKLALRLDFPNVRNPEEPAMAMVAFGPHQRPDAVVAEARQTWRGAKIPKSRFYEMSEEERTRLLADHFGSDDLSSEVGMVSDDVGVMYDAVRAVLLAGGGLCRLDEDLGPDELLDSFDRLLAAKDLDGLTRREADEILAGVDARSGFGLVDATYRNIDWLAEQRGRRLAFVHDGGPTYLIGLVPSEAADDWDGQTVGDGTAQVTLSPPD